MMRNTIGVYVFFAFSLLAATGSAQCGPEGCRLPGSASPPAARPARPVVPLPLPDDVPEPVRQSYHSLVRIRCDSWGGSGTYLGGRLAITCEHVLRQASGPVEVEFPCGKTLQAKVLATDYAADLALLELLGDAPTEARGIALCESPPAVGEVVYSAGYGRLRTLMLSAGRISNLDQVTIACDPTNNVRRFRKTAEATGLTEPGDSGGAWLARDGRLRAVVWGGRPEDGTVSATTELGDFLRGACDRWRRPFPQPDPPPAPIAPAPLPPVKIDLAPIEAHLDAIEKRLALLEQSPAAEPDNRALAWFAMLAAAVGAAMVYYKLEEK
ncbi:MAG: trypsin-like peptidase domain-containing protein [Rhodopirellula sp.]|nr:trypsin-like peptidase domain-containing protein [Rhodopirellula sp.]